MQASHPQRSRTFDVGDQAAAPRYPAREFHVPNLGQRPVAENRIAVA